MSQSGASSSASSASPSFPSSSPATSATWAPRAVSNREEDAMMKEVRAAAVQKCDGVTRQFAQCAEGRTFSVLWKCWEENKAFKACLAQHMSADAIETAKKQWLDNHRKATLRERPSAATPTTSTDIRVPQGRLV